MSAVNDLAARLITAGWTPLHYTTGAATYYRWRDRRRIELHLLFDAAGRLDAWSVWANERVTDPDQEPGRRQRLNDYIKAAE